MTRIVWTNLTGKTLGEFLSESVRSAFRTLVVNREMDFQLRRKGMTIARDLHTEALRW
jgi:hypothetical protein